MLKMFLLLDSMIGYILKLKQTTLHTFVGRVCDIFLTINLLEIN